MNCQSSSSEPGSSKSYSGCSTGRHPGARGGVPEPAADVALDRLRHQPLAADALQQHLPRHLALAEAGDLRALREVGRRRARRRGGRRATAPARSAGPGSRASSSTWVCTRPFKQRSRRARSRRSRMTAWNLACSGWPGDLARDLLGRGLRGARPGQPNVRAERTRTPSSEAHQARKPAGLPVPPRPRVDTV